MLDIGSNRESTKYSLTIQLRRIMWALIKPLFCYSPRICFGWRRFLLRLFGAKVGRDTNIYNSATIYMPWNLIIGNQSSIGEWTLVYNLGKIQIGSNATISQRCHLCAGTHDYENPVMPLIKPEIIVNDDVWVCADAFIGPGVTVGQGGVVGARAVVVKDVAPWTVVAGNPAKLIKTRFIRH